MALIGQTYLTLMDVLRRTQGDNIADIIELLSEVNPILQDMVIVEANDGATNLTTMRSGIPEGTFRKLYQGVQPQKSAVIQIRDASGMIENWSEIDAKLVELSPNAAKLRLTEATAFIEGLNQTMANRIFYGSTVGEPSEFLGLAPRFNDKSAPNGAQIIDAGGSGNANTSIWFLVWGDRTLHGFYPRGSKAGLQREDKGKTTKTLPDGSVYDVYREKFSWDLGLSVRDWRYVARIANIDVADMAAGNVKLYDFMRHAYYRLHQRRVAGGRAAIYCNRDVMEALDALATNAGASDSFIRLRPMEIEGKEVLTYRGIPIRETDALLNTEAPVVSPVA
jgi:hypothetical protein